MMSHLRRRITDLRSRENDRGMTLVELIVYMILLGIVVSIIASVIISTLQKQREIGKISEVTNTGQGVVSSIDMAVANAAGFSLRTSPAGSQLLVTKTRSTLDDPAAVNEARCIGYFYDATTKTLHSVSDPLGSPGTPRSRVADTPSFTGAAGWPVLAEDVTASSAGPFFARLADASKLSVRFSIASLADRAPVTFEVTTGTRGQGTITDSGACWNV